MRNIYASLHTRIIMVALYNDSPLSVSELSQVTSLHPSNTSTMLNLLESHGVVTKKKDGRFRYISLTEKGKKYAEAIKAMDSEVNNY